MNGIEEGTRSLFTCPRVGPWAGTSAQGGLLAGGQRDVAERPRPSLEAQALERGPSLEAVGIVRTGLLGTHVQQSLRVWGQNEAGQNITLVPDGPLPTPALKVPHL